MWKILLFCSCGFAVAADMLLVWWAKNKTHPNWSIIIGMILINLASLLWVYSMYKGVKSAIAITLYSLLTVSGCVLLGHVIFNEQLSIINIIGLFLGIIAIILINI